VFGIVKYYLYKGGFHCKEYKLFGYREVREGNVAELCILTFAKRLFWHYIRETACSKGAARSFLF
jgi:hypothetical protein